MKKFDSIDILIPVLLEGADKTAAGIAGSLIDLYNAYGFTRFALVMPDKGWRRTGYPPREYFEQMAERFLAVKNLLPPEISCGWWHTLVLKSGPTPGYTRVVRLNGTEAPFSTCPLDPAYRERFAEDVAFVLQKAHPDFFVTEDDFGINCHGGPGCFCQHHLEEFARREGRFYSREELQELFTQKPVESRELLRRWQVLAKDSLVLFAQTIREKADKGTPEIPMGLMQPGCDDHDGCASESVARAIAGKDHVPFVRFYGTFYCGERIADIPAVLYSAIHAREHIKGEMRFYHESDTYPHSRFYTSGSCMRTMMGCIYSCGYDGSVFQAYDGSAVQPLPDAPARGESAYGKMYRKERTRFDALRKTVEGCRLKGVQIYRDPFDAVNFSEMEPRWIKAVTAFGIPFTTVDAPVAFLSGEQMRFMKEEEIKGFLAKTLVLDGSAAKVLTELGYGEFTGAEVRDTLLQGNDKFDLGAKEVISTAFFPESAERKMARADVYCPPGNGVLYRLEIREPDCREVTAIVNSESEYMAPGMSIFKNKLGGTVIIYATSVEGNFASSLFNYRRQALLQKLLVDCGADVPMVRKEPKVFLITNVPETEKDFSAVLTIANLAVDPLEELELFLPDSLRTCEEFTVLDREGKWQKIDVEKISDGVRLKHVFNYADPVYLMIR